MKYFYFIKLIYFPVVVIFLHGSVLLGNQLPYEQQAPLIDHLTEVNREWTNQQDIDLNKFSLPVSFTNDEQRIQIHLKLVSQLLALRIENRDNKQQANRLKNLKNLNAYWQRGLFPENTGHPGQRQPYFIDVYGTACAVGHLLQTSGERQFADQIAMENNHALIRELASPKLLQWAAENGITLAELAWIQPGYGDPICYSVEPVANTWPLLYEAAPNISPDIKTLFTLPGDSLMMIGGNFKALSSAGSGQNIVGWTGSNLILFDTTITGTVLTIEYYDNKIFIGGNFNIKNTNFHNIAWWDGNAWQGIQSGPMGGEVYALKGYQCRLYVGGNFTTVNNAPMANLAAWDGTTWSNLPLNCDGIIPTTPLQTNGTVRALAINEGYLIVGGNFTSVGNSLQADALASWENGWLNNYYTDFLLTFVNSLDGGGDYDRLWIGSNGIYRAGYQLYDYGPSSSIAEVNSLRFKNYSVIYAQDSLFSIFRYYDASGYPVMFNGQLNAVEWFQDEIYAGGMFESSTACEEYTLAKSLVRLHNTPTVPVEMHSFEVKLVTPSMSEIRWSTDTEINSAFFEIERRTDSQSGFVAVGEVKAAGESNNRLHYHFTDDTLPLKGTLYYRLKMTDADGSFSYSEIKSVQLPEQNRVISVFPSPAQDHLNIALNVYQNRQAIINVYNTQGQLLRSILKFTADNEGLRHPLDVKDFSNGLYILEVIMGNDTFSYKFQVLK